jgi:hypothetical protein
MGVNFFPFTSPHREEAYNVHFQYTNKISSRSKTKRIPEPLVVPRRSLSAPGGLRLRGWRKEDKAKVKVKRKAQGRRLKTMPDHPRWVPYFSGRLRSWARLFSRK